MEIADEITKQNVFQVKNRYKNFRNTKRKGLRADI